MRDDLTDERRRELFIALVAVQDEGLSAADSRELVAQQFGVDILVVRAVENEGLDKKWHPFGKG